MSGKRLLDAARVYGALKSVAKSHIAIRSQQLDTYNKTSSLAKAVKNQTDRVTVTAGAAYALAKRLSEDVAPPRPREPWPMESQSTYDIPTQDYQSSDHATLRSTAGLAQDHHYDRSADYGSQDEVAAGELHLHQQRGSERLLPDGTIPPSGSRLGSSTAPGSGETFGVRQAGAETRAPLEEDDLSRQDMDVTQKRAKSHALPDGTIPPQGASIGGRPEHAGADTFSDRPTSEASKSPLDSDHQAEQGFSPKESRSSTIPDPAFAARKAQQLSEMQIPSRGSVTEPHMDSADTFSERSQDTEPTLSSLPRSKIPQHVESSDGVSNKQGLNQDVYYSPSPDAARTAAPQEEEVPEGVDLNIFHSPQVAGMLRSGGREDRRKAYEAKLNAARRARGVPEQAAQPAPPVTKQAKAEEDDTKRLAETLAAEAASQQTSDILADEVPTSKYEMHESRVPSSRLGRIWQFGGLATSMAFGAMGETFRRATGGSSDGSIMLSEANMERLVAKLSRMRGAALKLGQMMSFQDSKLLPPAINAVLQRVQDSADYMPPSQRNKVLANSLGKDWKDLFSSFDDVPIAAASIGQVHRAVLASSGQQVAVKVQYPGVRSSITSDLNNLSLLLTASRLLPKGLYLDKTIANAQTELAWECDYTREAECGQRFAELVKDDSTVFTVPKVFLEACGPEVLTAEFMYGKGVTKITDLSQDERDWIGTQILRLCLRELLEWRFMQTDPNWTNFLYNRKERKLELLDFGASRDFPEAFVTPYVELLIAASEKDRAICRNRSIELGYLTGAESKAMLDAHVDSILTLAEPFMATQQEDEAYDFRDQTITDRVRAKIGLMVRERLSPPPEETYSLHRKLSGAFLLCARLGSRVKTREMFVNAVEKWRARKP